MAEAQLAWPKVGKLAKQIEELPATAAARQPVATEVSYIVDLGGYDYAVNADNGASGYGGG